MFLGRDLSCVRALAARLLGAAGWVGLGALVLGLAGALVIGRGVARRTAAMGEALGAVAGGDLDRRLPQSGRVGVTSKALLRAVGAAFGAVAAAATLVAARVWPGGDRSETPPA